MVVSTNTINLQDQLFTKDLPVLHKVLDDGRQTADGQQTSSVVGRPSSPFKAALLKGKSNYICLRRWYSFRKSSPSSIEQYG